MPLTPSSGPFPASEPGKPSAYTAAGSRNRLGGWLKNRIFSWVGVPWQRRLAWAALQIPKIRHFEAQFDKLNSDELRTMGMRLRGRARGGESLDLLLPEAFGLVCVASKRTLQMRPYDVQLAGGIIMHKGALAELATGEGKTLTASLPVFLNALEGKGVHVTTVNDYLARRDAELMGPIYGALGLTFGCIQMQMGEQDRQKAYRSDITYGTASEFGFDFLRDRLKAAGAKGQEQPFWAPWHGGQNPASSDPYVQRGHHYALVDEADNIFIDEARTPLIIAGPTRLATPEEIEVYMWADALAQTMQHEVHFNFDQKKQKLELTRDGQMLAIKSNPPRQGADSLAMDKLYERLEQALHAHIRFKRDQHYMIEKEKIVIIDEYTGRRMPDRHWREGLHQAVEAKERVPIHFPSDHAAQVTYQSYFRQYTKLSGMTGTAAQNWFELYRVYKLWVVCVPTNRPVIRKLAPDRVFPNEDAKFDAIVKEVIRMRDLGRSVLIGTRSVEKSEKLSNLLRQANVDHEVLNARFHEMEAQIIAQAGNKGRVTIATNMAGRGTDIKPEDEVLAAGGLHVLGTERHDALRIDRQLIGRAGRQGDPGSAQFFISLEDELLEALGQEKQESLKLYGAGKAGGNWDGYLKLFKRAQKKVEARHYKSRVDLMVHEKQRQEILKDLGADPYVD
ncbi:MAG: preprotein translocase subunit SecA [Gemmataceae bacterium]